MKKIFALMIIALIFPVVANAEIRLQDNFEYEATRTGTGADAFVNHGPWDGAMSINRTGGNAGTCGYLYTVTTAEFRTATGTTGNLPGQSSSRVACFEFLPLALNCQAVPGWYQSNLYLVRYSATNQAHIPANVWIQYWIYINHYTGQETTFVGHGTKWLYPCIDGSPTCSAGASWLYSLGLQSQNPYLQVSDRGNGYAYGDMEGLGGHAHYSPASENHWHMGHNKASGTGLLSPNQWILVKIHTDITGSSPLAPAGQGVYEEWQKTVSGSFVKVAEWIGGVTPNFYWAIHEWDRGGEAGRTMAAGHEIGQKSLKIGTTWNDSNGWIYVDDFVIATAEADLPTYGGGGAPQPPLRLRIIP